MKRILLVDNSQTMLKCMEGFLKRAGFDVKTATNANNALGLIDSFTPDLVTTDLNLPDSDGIELIKQIKKKPNMQLKPILMLTTDTQELKKLEAKEAGATGWLIKPVSPIDMISILRKTLSEN